MKNDIICCYPTGFDKPQIPDRIFLLLNDVYAMRCCYTTQRLITIGTYVLQRSKLIFTVNTTPTFASKCKKLPVLYNIQSIISI